MYIRKEKLYLKGILKQNSQKNLENEKESWRAHTSEF